MAYLLSNLIHARHVVRGGAGFAVIPICMLALRVDRVVAARVALDGDRDAVAAVAIISVRDPRT